MLSCGGTYQIAGFLLAYKMFAHDAQIIQMILYKLGVIFLSVFMSMKLFIKL